MPDFADRARRLYLRVECGGELRELPTHIYARLPWRLLIVQIDAVSAVAPRGVAWRDLGPACSRRMDVSRLAAIVDNVYMQHQQIDCANLAWLHIYNIPSANRSLRLRATAIAGSTSLSVTRQL